MQIKSWQIALTSVIVQAIVEIFQIRDWTLRFDQLIFLLLPVLYGLIFAVLFYFNKTKKIAAIFSIFLSSIILILSMGAFGPATIIFLPILLLSLLTGLYFFWKKV